MFKNFSYFILRVTLIFKKCSAFLLWKYTTNSIYNLDSYLNFLFQCIVIGIPFFVILAVTFLRKDKNDAKSAALGKVKYKVLPSK